MAANIVLGLFLVVFIIVVFIIAQCRNMHDITPHGATAAEALIFSSAVVQKGSWELVMLIIISEQIMAETIKMAE